MKMTIFLFAALRLAMPTQVDAAGFENSAEKSSAEWGKYFETKTQALVGKTFFAYLDRRRCRYPWAPEIQSRPIFFDPKTYTSETPKRFVVERIVRSESSGSSFRFYQLKFEDGALGFIELSKFEIGNSKTEESLTTNCFSELDPKEMQSLLDKFAADRKVKLDAETQARAEERRKSDESIAKRNAERAAQSEAERIRQEVISKRPNPALGMTAKQVIEKTNWGEPQSVNRTATKYGVDEQWVYSLKSYLYFKNGRLIAIQN